MKLRELMICRPFLGPLFGLLVVCSVAAADDKDVTPTEKPVEQSQPKPSTEGKTEPTEKSLLEKLGDELMKEVDDSPVNALKAAVTEEVDKMDRAVKGMRTAGSKLDEGSTAEET